MGDPNAAMLDVDFCSFSLFPGNAVGKMYSAACTALPQLPENLAPAIFFVFTGPVFQ